MSLLALPPELIDAIIGYTLPDGLESFVLSCKTVYGIGKPHIREHIEYQRRWRRFAFNESAPGRPSMKTVLELLLEISKDPFISHYIETACLWNKDQSDEDEETRARSIMKSEANVASIGRLLRRSEHLKVANEDPEVWLQYLAFHDYTPGIEIAPSNYATTLLLTLLPNVKNLGLPFHWVSMLVAPVASDPCSPDVWAGPGGPWAVLDAINKLANASPTFNMALHKLQCVLPHADMSYDQRNGLEEMAPFMALDTLNEMYTCNMVAVDDNYTGIPFKWRYPDVQSGLCRLEIVSGCIDGGGIAELLKHTPHLKTFRYSHHTKWHGCLHDWNAGEFVAMIAEHRGDTLTELAVTIDCLFGEVEQGVASLRRFRRLESAEFDVQIFYAPPWGDEEALGQNNPALKSWTYGDVPTLASILPASTKRLHLFEPTDESRHNTQRFHRLLGIDGEHTSRLFDLVQFDIQSERGTITHADIQALPTRGEAKQRALDALRRDKLQTGTPNRMPRWKERFHERFGSLVE